jgi:hypothetical protein
VEYCGSSDEAVIVAAAVLIISGEEAVKVTGVVLDVSDDLSKVVDAHRIDEDALCN